MYGLFVLELHEYAYDLAVDEIEDLSGQCHQDSRNECD